jgi:uncharacterized protein YbbC (DUF1343 family)
MNTLTGLDRLSSEDFARLRGKTIGLLCNQASITRDFRHAVDLLLERHRAGDLRVQAVFGPQHGLYGHTQDNMIEWEGKPDARFGVPIFSLYGEHREPTDAMLEGIEVLVVDLQDVGARYYTFIWTLALCMKACERLRIPLLILDRPNPLGGATVEGTLLDSAFSSFVGLHPIPSRHGMTFAEIGLHLHTHHYPGAQMEVVLMEKWDREMYFDETGLPWGMPSPNMPTPESAIPYPGGCLLEATNVSEGRGTTRPFEIVGAPFVDGWHLAERMQAHRLEGVVFRPLQFEPTFNKHAQTLCEGVFIHVVDRRRFEPLLAHVALLQELLDLSGGAFSWNPPPYEYEYEKLPIDILAGNDWLRKAIEEREPLARVRERFQDECAQFDAHRQDASLYPGT